MAQQNSQGINHPGNNGLPPGLDPKALGLNQRQVNLLMSDPRLRQQLLNSLQNPNGDILSFKDSWDRTNGPDGVGFVPSLESCGWGALAGLGTWGAIEGLFTEVKGNPLIIKIANGIDRLPGVSEFSQWVHNNVTERLYESSKGWGTKAPSGPMPTDAAKKAEWLQQQFKHQRHLDYVERFFGKAKPVEVQKRAILDTLESLKRMYFNDKGSNVYDDLVAHTQAKADAAMKAGKHTHDLYNEDFMPKLDELLGEIHGDEGRRVGILLDRNQAEIKRLFPDGGEARKLLLQNNVKGLKQYLNTPDLTADQKNLLEKLVKEADSDHYLFKANQHIRQRLGNPEKMMSGGLSSLDHEPYRINYQYRQKLLSHAAAKGGEAPGFVSRSILKFTDMVRDIFSGRMFGSPFKAGGWKAKAGAALMAMFAGGVMTFGFAFDSAKRADDGQKTAGFFHNLLGEGIMSFVGWTVFQNTLNGMNFFPRLIDKLGALKDKTRIGRWGPFKHFLSSAVKKRKFIAGAMGFTTAGLATFLTSMLLGGHIFQRIGEKFSTLIFGTPDHVERERKAMEGQFPAEPFEPPTKVQHAKGFNALENQVPTTRPVAVVNPMPTHPMLGKTGLGQTGFASPANPYQSQTQVQNQNQYQHQPKNQPIGGHTPMNLSQPGVPIMPPGLSNDPDIQRLLKEISDSNHIKPANLGALQPGVKAQNSVASPNEARLNAYKEALKPIPYSAEQLRAIEESQAYIRDQEYLKANDPEHMPTFEIMMEGGH